MHGRPDDPRINTFWDEQTAAFDKAISLLPRPGRRVSLKADGFDVLATFYAASDEKAPVMILGNEYDGAQEEMLHVCGFAALERGYHVITYEGPGQPTVRRQQGLGFIPDWEKVVTPLVDYLETFPQVDMKRLGLLGYSMGGYLALRASAFEHRLAAFVAIDGVYNVFEAYYALLPPPWRRLFDSDQQADHQKMDEMVLASLKDRKAPSKVRWGIEQGLWSFNVSSPWQWLHQTKAFAMEGIAEKVKCHAWIGDAAEDLFFLGQPLKIHEVLGEKSTLRRFTAADGASNHFHCGSSVLINQVVFDWFDSI